VSKAKSKHRSDEDLIAEAILASEGSNDGETMHSLDVLELEMEEIQQLLREKEGLLETIGVTPGKRAEGVVRVVYENVNGLKSQIGDMSKLDKLKCILNDLQADCFAFNEHRINFRHRENRRRGVTQLFNGGEMLVRGIGAFNKMEKTDQFIDKRTLEGGTGMVAYGELASLMNPKTSGVDETGLGRWTYMEFIGADGHTTVILCGYAPCYNNRPNSGTTYQQHRRFYIEHEGQADEPRARFLSDLTSLLKKWKDEGKRIIVCMDANENVYKGIIGRTLTDAAGLDMQETVLATNGTPLTATHFRGTRPIDAIWATKDLEVVNACALPVGFGVGDHRMFVVDFTLKSMVGEDPKIIAHPQARRLNSRIPSCHRKYIQIFESLIAKHRLIDKLNEAHVADVSPEVRKEKIDKIDEIGKDCMLHAEKKCRKIRSGTIPFSPEASLWIKRCQFYRSLLRFWAGRKKNRGNLKRAARRCKIANPFSLTPEEVSMRLRECKNRLKHFKIHGQKYRSQHLRRRLDAAKESGDDEAEKRILQIICRERERSFWRRLNWALGTRRGSSVSAVQVDDGEGGFVEYVTQDGVQKALWRNVHRKRYHMAEEAPICQGKECLVTMLTPLPPGLS
jgi:hypothetical protein